MIPPTTIQIRMPDLALAIALIVHRGQQDKAGKPYTEHLRHVADRLISDKDKTIAYLHDMIEDTSVTPSDLSNLFPNDVVATVLLLTRRPDETYAGFIERICLSNNFSAIAVKYADVKDHLRETSAIGSSLIDRYTKAEARLLEVVCLDVISQHGSPAPS